MRREEAVDTRMTCYVSGCIEETLETTQCFSDKPFEEFDALFVRFRITHINCHYSDDISETLDIKRSFVIKRDIIVIII